tara:strand:- start:2492 stop:4048 length:1557 start_codon:yes stop_codon:yes gene_type:complete
MISDITFVGCGIATSFTLLNLVTKIDPHNTHEVINIRIIDKYPEFFSGIPYGRRSGGSVLLINSLRNFLPDPERSMFISWLKIHKTSLIEDFIKAGGVKSVEWVNNYSEEINRDTWEDLFVPRVFFGKYISEKVTLALEKAEKKGLVKIEYTVAKVIDVQKVNNIFDVLLEDGKCFKSNKVVLSLGSLPTKKLNSNIDDNNNSFLLIDDIYNQELLSNLGHIENFLSSRKGMQNNVLVIGANASALEIIYKLNDEEHIGNSITNFIILSTHGLIPDSEVNEEKRKDFIPKNLHKLQVVKEITAQEIAEAAFQDLEEAKKMNLGAASTVDIISSAFGVLLHKLPKQELKNFACFYGNEIGRLQRCAGRHYTDVVQGLKENNRVEHLSGKYHELIGSENDGVNLEYLDTKSQKIKRHSKNINLIINCIGSTNFDSDSIPLILKNLVSKGLCIPNDSKIGIHVNNKLEASEGLFLAGPLLAGNVINNKPVWHVEHCGRIIWLSEILANNIATSLRESKIKC